MTEYLTCAETAKLIRKQLKQHFPGVKFSVRSATYSGGASIDIYWTDGPTEAQVSPITSPFAGGRFDGMIDMAYSASSWLNEDGTASVAYSPGTYGQRGSDPEVIGSRSTGTARLVHFGSDYVFLNRTESEGFRASCSTLVEDNGTFGRARATRCDGCGDWKQEHDPCFVAHTTRHGSEWTGFVCSPECGGRLIARNTQGV